MTIDTLSSQFLEGLERLELRYQACRSCGAAQRLARYACTRCGDVRLEWRVAEGKGRVVALTVVHRAPSDEFRALAPYSLALVDLREGTRLMGHAAPGLHIGDPVEAKFFRVGSRRLIRFEPA